MTVGKIFEWGLIIIVGLVLLRWIAGAFANTFNTGDYPAEVGPVGPVQGVVWLNTPAAVTPWYPRYSRRGYRSGRAMY